MARAEGGMQPDSVASGAETLTATEWGLPSEKDQEEVEGQDLGG